MKKRYYLVLAVIAMLTVYLRAQKQSPVVEASATGVIAQMESHKGAASEAPFTASLQGESSTLVQGIAERDDSYKELLSNNFSKHLEKMGQCLDIKNIVFSELPTLQSLNVSLKPEMGDLSEVSTEWFNTHIDLPNGEQRRVRIEVEGRGEESSHRILKYYGLDREGLPISLPVPQDQKYNPSASYIGQLEQEGKVVMREKASRAVFSGGGDLYYVERNGLLKDIEVTLKDRSFKCSGMESLSATCTCF